MQDECMLYAGYKNGLGYGQIFHGRFREYAHRVFYTNFKGTIPEGLVIDHLCKIRCCINPDHLEAVTARVNTLRGDGVACNRAKTHCPQGHAYTAENTQVFGRHKWRRCRQCAVLRHRADRRAKAST